MLLKCCKRPLLRAFQCFPAFDKNRFCRPLANCLLMLYNKVCKREKNGRYYCENLLHQGGIAMTETFDIAGYCRISVDDELDQKNISIENQKAILADYVKTHFPGSSLTFFEDRDRSGYTFSHREGYQEMRRGLMSHKFDILLVKDFSRFARRNSRGLAELEDLRDAGVRIISVGDGIDFPNDDDWLKIQFQFLINEMPVTDTSRKVQGVIKRR